MKASLSNGAGHGDNGVKQVENLISRCGRRFRNNEPIKLKDAKLVLASLPAMSEGEARNVASSWPAGARKIDRQVVQALCVLGEDLFVYHSRLAGRMARTPVARHSIFHREEDAYLEESR